MTAKPILDKLATASQIFCLYESEDWAKASSIICNGLANYAVNFKYNFYYSKFLAVEPKMLAHREFLNNLHSSFLTPEWYGVHLPNL